MGVSCGSIMLKHAKKAVAGAGAGVAEGSGILLAVLPAVASAEDEVVGAVGSAIEAEGAVVAEVSVEGAEVDAARSAAHPTPTKALFKTSKARKPHLMIKNAQANADEPSR
jgi:hypothetical protein